MYDLLIEGGTVFDGHNLIGKLSSIDLTDPDDEQQLIRLLDGYMLANNKRGVVYFDRGAPGGERNIRMGRLEIRFVRPPLDADSAILRYIEKIKPQATNFIVVTSDHQIRKAVERSGARWMKSEEFASLILRRDQQNGIPPKPDQQLSPGDIEDWERLFNSGKEDK